MRERLCLRVPIINNTLYQTQWAMFLQIKTHWLCSQQKQWYQISPAKDNSNNTSTLKTPIYSIYMTSYPPYNHRQTHIKPADRGFSPGLQDLFTPDIFFFYLTTWTFNLEKLLRQGRGFGGAALFSLISLKKKQSPDRCFCRLFFFISDGQL